LGETAIDWNGSAMHDLIIARYAESLDWVEAVPRRFAVRIFNKGAPITDPAILARCEVVDRPNIGREGETYLHHIAAFRPDPGLGEAYTVFAQGDPFEHSPDFLSLLEKTAMWDEVQPLSWRWKIARKIPPEVILHRETGAFVGGLRVRPETFSLCTWAPAGFDDPGAQWLNENYRRLHDLPEGSNIAAHFLASCGLDRLAVAAQSHLCGRFAYGAVFGVRTCLLGQIPRPSLELLTRAMSGHAVYGYVLERLWLHLFGCPFVLPVQAELPDLPAAAEAFQPPESIHARRRRKVAQLANRVGHLVAGG
jgi:hypothetical protein